MPELRLTVIGPGPAYTRRRGRTSSCYLVEGGGAGIVLGLGQGSFAALGAPRGPRTRDALPRPPLVAGRRHVGALVVQAERVTPTDSSYGFRVTLGDGGPGLVYSGGPRPQ